MAPRRPTAIVSTNGCRSALKTRAGTRAGSRAGRGTGLCGRCYAPPSLSRLPMPQHPASVPAPVPAWPACLPAVPEGDGRSLAPPPARLPHTPTDTACNIPQPPSLCPLHPPPPSRTRTALSARHAPSTNSSVPTACPIGRWSQWSLLLSRRVVEDVLERLTTLGGGG